MPKASSAACREAAAAELPCRLMIDASHGNSLKDPRRQIDVIADVAGQVRGGERRIFGVMIESHLVEGRQELGAGDELTYGQSITDACLGWEDTVGLLDTLAASVADRRSARSRTGRQ